MYLPLFCAANRDKSSDVFFIRQSQLLHFFQGHHSLIEEIHTAKSFSLISRRPSFCAKSHHRMCRSSRTFDFREELRSCQSCVGKVGLLMRRSSNSEPRKGRPFCSFWPWKDLFSQLLLLSLSPSPTRAFSGCNCTTSAGWLYCRLSLLRRGGLFHAWGRTMAQEGFHM